MFRPVLITQGIDLYQAIRELLQEAVSLPLGDRLEYKIGAMQVDITTAPYGGERYPYRHSTSHRRLNSRVS